MQPLTNDRWGFPSNCFVCEPTNEAGLRIPFFHDEDDGSVVARFALDHRFSGAPTFAHGGVLLAVLDEAMAWATIAIAHRWAVTGETTTRFEAPVRVDVDHEVRARLRRPVVESASTLEAEAEIRTVDGERCASARATFVVLGEAQVADAGGIALDDVDRSWTRSS